ncbi:MAG: winged helix-turn-helix domain-containing protein [Candidatus Riflebacteria bacterium]|nr:winged helix-turn-helix domain-containing protein [Candidatus Riflebacteria bacterium]
MPVPDYQSLMLPLLRFVAEKNVETSTSEAVEGLAKILSMKDEDLNAMLPSGTQFTFFNRISWAAMYMKKACLIETTRRGYYRITNVGMNFLGHSPKLSM